MAFSSYPDDRLQEILAHWRDVNPSPGSMGDRALQACEEEISRRAAARRHPAGPV